MSFLAGLMLNEKLLLGEEREGHNLYLKERGREQIFGNTERPADIVRRRLEQAGYDVADGFDLLAGDGLSFLLKFVYKSQVFGPTEQNLNIEDYERVDLSGRSLRTIPVALHQHADQIVSLYLSRNPMLDLPLDLIQSCISLTELRLSQMGHKRVPVNVSAALSLTRLDISSNRIGDLDNAYLKRIPGLQTLYAQNNRMERLPWHFPRLRALTRLNISNNKFRVLPTVVCQLENLRNLDILFNSISDLPEELGLLRNLEHLIIVGNQISKIPPEATGLVSLCRLDCRRNLIADLTVISTLPKLEKLSADHNTLHGLDLCLGPLLTTIDASFNEITQIEQVPGPVGRPPSSLISLDVSHAKLSSLDSLTLNELVSLRNLNLSYSQFKFLPSSLGNLDYLETLFCSDNILEELPASIGKLKRLEVLDVHNNNLTELSGELWNCPSLIKLNATRVGLEEDDLHMHPFPERQVSTVSLTDASSSLSISIHLPSLAYALERLYLGKNQLTSETLEYFLPLFQELKKSNLEELYLSGNGLTMLPTEDLVKMTKLGTLYLNENRLQSLPQELGKVKSLTVLDLGSNSLKYNIYNWEFDWNWNFNKNLKYLNLSGNKHLQIKSDHTKLPGGSRQIHITPAATSTSLIRQQSLGGFTDLIQLRVLGLMDVTITTTGITVCGMAYGIADTLGRNDHLNMVDLVHEFSSSQDHHKNEAIFAIFGRSQPPKATPGVSGNRIAKFLRDKFVEVFCTQLAGLNEARAEGVPDALRRSFLKVNQNLHKMLFTNQKYSASNGGSAFLGPDMHDAVVSRGGASGVALYFQGKTMYIANAGNALTGLVNNEIDISRSFGFFHLLPIVNARLDIATWELSELDEFVIVADCRLWDFVLYKIAVDIVRWERGDPMLAAQKLRDFAMSYGADGSTMIMVISVADLFRTDEPRSREGSIVDPQLLQDEVPAPTGYLALVFTDIRNSTHLWDVNRGMNTAWRLHNTLLRRKLRFCGGYKVKTEGDAFMCAFSTTMAAVWWCLAVQMELLDEDWPLEILECEDGKLICDLDNRPIARGLSVCMGIHCGALLCEVDPVNHQMDYFGPMVNRSARINSSAAGGQIMCSKEVIREIRAKLYNGPATLQSEFQPAEAVDNVWRLGVTIFEVGAVKLKGLELPEQLSLIYPDASGSRVQFSMSQIWQLGLVCLWLESLATSRIFREMAEWKSSIQMVSDNDNDKEEASLYIYGDPNLLLPALDENMLSDRDMMLVLDALSRRIENAVAEIRERVEVCSAHQRL
ncbi:hypothetical protein BT96DRAFT_1071856 [Gymnopus androsaceus JB14]|uniref:Adenylate cyclase n=1 Tax=Gymnopus androsaceus JB14 TaxID=1447944 RepID=A0A6A4GV05_9AGAR|nr:hypothetical protein BT96DRAFT_1071856 [Gymnopus androsaceus JB14]